MHNLRGARSAVHPGLVRLLPLLLAGGWGAAADTPPPVVDSQSIVRSLTPHTVATRGLVIEAKTPAGAEPGGGSARVNLDIRFASDSDVLTGAAQAQLAQLGQALSSPELARSHFLIAGHTSATGSPTHNQHLSESRARSVRAYLIAHFKIAPERIAATGYGSSRPLPDFPPAALQQRRVEISALPAT
jgi:outer membrane protein OmpA-like peptidoglycan-associated protein